MQVFRLLHHCSWGLHCFGMWRCITWTDCWSYFQCLNVQCGRPNSWIQGMYRYLYACSFPAGKVNWANQGAVRGAGCTYMKYRHTRMWVRLGAKGLLGWRAMWSSHQGLWEEKRKWCTKMGMKEKEKSWTCCTREQYSVTTFILKHNWYFCECLQHTVLIMGPNPFYEIKTYDKSLFFTTFWATLFQFMFSQLVFFIIIIFLHLILIFKGTSFLNISAWNLCIWSFLPAYCSSGPLYFLVLYSSFCSLSINH